VALLGLLQRPFEPALGQDRGEVEERLRDGRDGQASGARALGRRAPVQPHA
jgi:hypothetical protein